MPLAEQIAQAIDRYHAENPDLTVWEILEAFDEIAATIAASLITDAQKRAMH